MYILLIKPPFSPSRCLVSIISFGSCNNFCGVSLPLPCVAEPQQSYLSEWGGSARDGNQGLFNFKDHAFSPWAIQPFATVICAFSQLHFLAAKGHYCPSSSVVGLWFVEGGSWSSVFPMGFLSLSSICSSISWKLCVGSSTLSPPDTSKWEKVTPSSGQHGLSTKRGKIISRDKKIFLPQELFL